jgi:hypothetical protein
MSNENWTATDCGKYIRVRAPNGGTWMKSRRDERVVRRKAA